MNVPLIGLGVFGGWIVLVVASDIFGILRIPQKRLSRVQTAFLIASIVAAGGCWYLYSTERVPACLTQHPRHAHR